MSWEEVRGRVPYVVVPRVTRLAKLPFSGRFTPLPRQKNAPAVRKLHRKVHRKSLI